MRICGHSWKYLYVICIFIDALLFINCKNGVRKRGKHPEGIGVEPLPESPSVYSDVVSDFIQGNPHPNVTVISKSRSKRATAVFEGVCRPGWVQGLVNQVPVCIHVNKEALSWDDAKDSCRKDFGFLLKVENQVLVGNQPIQKYLQNERISSVWTGLHEDDDTLLWDELVPQKVNALDRQMQSLHHALRIWNWDVPEGVLEEDVCGELDISSLPLLHSGEIQLRKKRNAGSLLRTKRNFMRRNSRRPSNFRAQQTTQGTDLRSLAHKIAALPRQSQVRLLARWRKLKSEGKDQEAMSYLLSEVQDPPVKREPVPDTQKEGLPQSQFNYPVEDSDKPETVEPGISKVTNKYTDATQTLPTSPTSVSNQQTKVVEDDNLGNTNTQKPFTTPERKFSTDSQPPAPVIDKENLVKIDPDDSLKPNENKPETSFKTDDDANDNRATSSSLLPFTTPSPKPEPGLRDDESFKMKSPIAFDESKTVKNTLDLESLSVKTDDKPKTVDNSFIKQSSASGSKTSESQDTYENNLPKQSSLTSNLNVKSHSKQSNESDSSHDANDAKQDQELLTEKVGLDDIKERIDLIDDAKVTDSEDNEQKSVSTSQSGDIDSSMVASSNNSSGLASSSYDESAYYESSGVSVEKLLEKKYQNKTIKEATGKYPDIAPISSSSGIEDTQGEMDDVGLSSKHTDEANKDPVSSGDSNKEDQPENNGIKSSYGARSSFSEATEIEMDQGKVDREFLNSDEIDKSKSKPKPTLASENSNDSEEKTEKNEKSEKNIKNLSKIIQTKTEDKSDSTESIKSTADIDIPDSGEMKQTPVSNTDSDFLNKKTEGKSDSSESIKSTAISDSFDSKKLKLEPHFDSDSAEKSLPIPTTKQKPSKSDLDNHGIKSTYSDSKEKEKSESASEGNDISSNFKKASTIEYHSEGKESINLNKMSHVGQILPDKDNTEEIEKTQQTSNDDASDSNISIENSVKIPDSVGSATLDDDKSPIKDISASSSKINAKRPVTIINTVSSSEIVHSQTDKSKKSSEESETSDKIQSAGNSVILPDTVSSDAFDDKASAERPDKFKDDLKDNINNIKSESIDSHEDDKSDIKPTISTKQSENPILPVIGIKVKLPVDISKDVASESQDEEARSQKTFTGTVEKVKEKLESDDSQKASKEEETETKAMTKPPLDDAIEKSKDLSDGGSILEQASADSKESNVEPEKLESKDLHESQNEVEEIPPNQKLVVKTVTVHETQTITKTANEQVRDTSVDSNEDEIQPSNNPSTLSRDFIETEDSSSREDKNVSKETKKSNTDLSLTNKSKQSEENSNLGSEEDDKSKNIIQMTDFTKKPITEATDSNGFSIESGEDSDITAQNPKTTFPSSATSPYPTISDETEDMKSDDTDTVIDAISSDVDTGSNEIVDLEQVTFNDLSSENDNKQKSVVDSEEDGNRMTIAKDDDKSTDTFSSQEAKFSSVINKHKLRKLRIQKFLKSTAHLDLDDSSAADVDDDDEFSINNEFPISAEDELDISRELENVDVDDTREKESNLNNNLLKLLRKIKRKKDKKLFFDKLRKLESFEDASDELVVEASSNNFERRVEDYEADDIGDLSHMGSFPTHGIRNFFLANKHRQDHMASMKLTSCERKKPSICFSPPLIVEQASSVCPPDWYGHVFVGKCYKVVTMPMTYPQAQARCQADGGDLADMSRNQRLVLFAIKKSRNQMQVPNNGLDASSNFWIKQRQPRSEDQCIVLTVNGFLEEDCSAQAEAVCERKSNHIVDDDNKSDDEENDKEEDDRKNDDVDSKEEEKGVMATRINMALRDPNRSLKCDLKTGAKELPTIWFKDGKVVDVIVQEESGTLRPFLGYFGAPKRSLPQPMVGNSNSLQLGARITRYLHDNRLVRGDEILQGTYWCEVWGVKPFTRHRSHPFLVRFSDVITFRGVIDIPRLPRSEQLLFDMIDKDVPEIHSIINDLRVIYSQIIPDMKKNIATLESLTVSPGKIEEHNPRKMGFFTFVKTRDNYTMAEEQTMYSVMRSQLKRVLNNATYILDLPNRTPINIIRSINFFSTVACPAAELTDRHTGVKARFGRAEINQKVPSVEHCNGQALGTATCKGDFYTGSFWDDVIIRTHCDEKPGATDSDEGRDGVDENDDDDSDEDSGSIFEKMSLEERLKELADMDMEEDNVDGIMEETADIIETVEEISGIDLGYIADIMEKTARVPRLPLKVGFNLLKTVDRILEVDDDDVIMVNKTAPKRIIQSFEKSAEAIELDDDGRLRLVRPNVVLEVWKINKMKSPVIGLAAKNGGQAQAIFQNESIFTLFEESEYYDDIDAAIELPKELVQTTAKDPRQDTRLYMMVYRDGKLFRGSNMEDNNRKLNVADHESEYGVLNSYVISASIGGKKIQGLKSKVRTVFKPLRPATSELRTCAYWDFNKNDNLGGWSTRGCSYDGQVNGKEICLCDHLTNFAVLVDFYGQKEPVSTEHDFALSLISLVGLSLSILGLSLTIISYVFFRKLRKGRAQQTLFNLAVAMLCSWLVFLIGIRQTRSHVVCIIVAILLHYFILSSFMWMLMEAFLQYLTFVKVLGTYVRRYTLKTGIVAWGMPLIPVLCVLSIDFEMYRGGNRYCWMSLSAFYYAFALPVGLIILCNLVVFIITVTSICNRRQGLRTNQSKQKMALTNLQAAITSFVLLGLTWILGYLAISDARIVFQYAFTILNTLQGFFIFVLFVVRKKQVRDQWLIACCCKDPQREKASRSLSATTSLPSTCSSKSSLKGRSQRSDSCNTTSSFISNDYETIYTLPYNRDSPLYYRKM